MSAREEQELILEVTCPPACGILASVTSFLAERGCYISELNHFDDKQNSHLFILFYVDSGEAPLASLSEEFAQVSERFAMIWQIVPGSAPTKTLLLMVSQLDHCLEDLLYRQRKGELNLEIPAVVSNHQLLRPPMEREGIRCVHLPVTRENRPQQERTLLDIVQETGTDLVVLARYMQILSDALCVDLSGRVINIHRSFLPGFKGAKPYHRAGSAGSRPHLQPGDVGGCWSRHRDTDFGQSPAVTCRASGFSRRQQDGDLLMTQWRSMAQI